MMPPTFGNGKICYIEIPATDVARSADFYPRVFGWQIRKSGFMLHVMVDSADATLDSIVQNGGEVVQPIGADAPEITATFRDPGGNVIGIYQHRG